MEANSQLNDKPVIRYSLALYKVAKDLDLEKALETNASSIIEKYENDDKFELLLTNPLLSAKNQVEVVKSVFSIKELNKLKVHKVMFSFLMVLAVNNRLSIMHSSLIKFKSMVVSKNRELNINVTTVKEIDENIKNQLIGIFSSKTKRKINIFNIVDKEILGGIIIEMGSNLIDASIRNKISKINGAIKGVN